MPRLMLLFLFVCAGFWLGSSPERSPKRELISGIDPDKQFPIREHKSFAIVIYAHNHADWSQRALRSVFEQDYDHYRVIVIDDASIDATSETAKQFILDNHQDDKVIVIRNDTYLGEVGSLYRVIDTVLDKEIVLPLNAKDWLALPSTLGKLNGLYQNPDVWLSFGSSIEYPSYSFSPKEQISFYAALFKQLHLKDLFFQGHFALNRESYLNPLIDLSGGRIGVLNEPLSFLNRASFPTICSRVKKPASYRPLATFPPGKKNPKADLLILSQDDPGALYATLASIQRYMRGFDEAFVIYQTKDPSLVAEYETVAGAFPSFRFYFCQEKIKNVMQKTILPSPAQYLAVVSDDRLLTDVLDLRFCMDQMEKTDAYGFYWNVEPADFQCESLGSGLWASQIDPQYEVGSPGLFKKSKIEKGLLDLKYKSSKALLPVEKEMALFLRHPLTAP